jgi:hypothetical protein
VINGVPTCICVEGYELDDVTTCVDIDECEENNGGCDHVCVNKPGTYTCKLIDKDVAVVVLFDHTVSVDVIHIAVVLSVNVDCNVSIGVLVKDMKIMMILGCSCCYYDLLNRIFLQPFNCLRLISIKNIDIKIAIL